MLFELTPMLRVGVNIKLSITTEPYFEKLLIELHL